VPGQTVNDLLSEARATIDRLEPAAALAQLERGALLIDTRCADARRDDGIVPGSVHVPLSVLYWRLDPDGFPDASLIDRRRRVIVMCAHGFSSSLAAATLRRLGFRRAADVIGGFEAWRAAGLPVASLGS